MADTKGKFPNYLREIMERTGTEPQRLAEAMDTPPQNIYRLVNGERELTKSWAERLAQHLPGARAAEFIFGPEGTFSPVEVPLYSTIQAGRLAEAPVVMDDDEPLRTVAEDLPPGDWLAFEVVGDSMNLIAPDGYIVFVNRKERELVNGGQYAVAVNGDATFKRYRSPPPRLEPMSTNPAHETMFVETPDAIKVIGRVRRASRNL